ncbi:NAD(P)-dependent oxidoreductase [Candidatus Cetobacterium colombiensis]|uniref:NAD(P)-dependent oxidoreductase n=1 Tax=Candidatus Cetobacterium colombiensis TaxID=3073100 RepID=A0ABU4WB79_9FUSO|nr:NAD(P)-dependent oxidoreductase [Candidatus Cetobacterium colombiensis]MDX8335811.1 NAD(P)-dependent oxidoreductase [Candidatus Cetobacterium colombiensis]
MKIDLINEANRCLNCKKPLCKIHCPISTDIPNIINLFKENKISEAGEILFYNNPLSIFCSIICPHEEQCKGHCIKGIKGTPVEFPLIEKEISTKYLSNLPLDRKNTKKIDIAIIGGGPAGITSAILLAKEGFNVTIFEAFSKLGGVLRYGIPEFRLSRELVDTFEAYLLNLGVKIKYNTLVGPTHTIQNLKDDGFKYIIITTGVWNPKPMDIRGETKGNVHYAINYLVSPDSYKLGSNVLVIGGGNVAMDAARVAKRSGSNVTVMYRRGEEDMPATKLEIAEAKEDGVNFKFYYAPKEILDDSMIFLRTQSITDESGRKKLITLDATDIAIPYSSIIVAVSQGPKKNIISSEDRISIEKWGTIVVNDDFETTLENVFSCGDVVTGPKTVVAAVNDAKKVVSNILNKEGLI